MLFVLLATAGLLLVACSTPEPAPPYQVDPANIRTPSPPDPWLKETLVSDEALMVSAITFHLSDPIHDLGWTSAYIPPPKPTATPAPAPLARPAGAVAAAAAVYSAGTEQWRSLVAAYFPAESVQIVLDIMQCESGGSPGATNGVHQGLMQENVNLHQAKADALFGPGRSLYEPEVNIAVAAVISGGYSWGAWADCLR
jgi:hypothetical protein